MIMPENRSIECVLQGAESVEVLDGKSVRWGRNFALYRVTVAEFAGANVKLIFGDGQSRLITPDSRSSTVDVAVQREFYIEATGVGSAKVKYAFLGLA